MNSLDNILSIINNISDPLSVEKMDIIEECVWMIIDESDMDDEDVVLSDALNYIADGDIEFEEDELAKHVSYLLGFIREDLYTNALEREINRNLYKYSLKRPMKFVSWVESRKSYTIRGEGINTRSKYIEVACEKAKELLSNKKRQKKSPIDDKKDSYSELRNQIPEIKDKGYLCPKMIPEADTKNHFGYQGEILIAYWVNGVPHFDIKKIISLLKLSVRKIEEKYKRFKSEIKYITLYKNEFGGYILQEFITDETMYEIIMSSNSSFSKYFKKDVSEILSTLRKGGKIIVSNEKISLLRTGSNELKFLNIPEDSDYVKGIIKRGSNINLDKYEREHVIYLVLTEIKGNLIFKPGYSYGIKQRLNNLKSEFKVGAVDLISIKIIKAEREEENFHTHLKNLYPKAVYMYSINGTKKTELYRACKEIIDEFESFPFEESRLKELEKREKMLEEKETISELKAIIREKDLEIKEQASELKLLAREKDLEIKELKLKLKKYEN